MSRGAEEYDSRQMIEGAEARQAEHATNARLLHFSGRVLELIASQLDNKAKLARFHPLEDSEITIDVKELMDIVGERSSSQIAADQIALGASAVFTAREFEAGRARAAQESADFLDRRLNDNPAAEDPVAGVEDS